MTAAGAAAGGALRHVNSASCPGTRQGGPRPAGRNAVSLEPREKATREEAVSRDGGYPIEGGCDCRAVRYRMTTAPLYVHCCHCRWCQRETGSAFVLNALIEADRVEPLRGEPVVVLTPSASGRGQKIARCSACHVALWSSYAGAGDGFRFVRVGTLDSPDRLPPDIHIFTASKQPWVVLPEGALAFEKYYDREKCWPAESLARRARHLGTQ